MAKEKTTKKNADKKAGAARRAAKSKGGTKAVAAVHDETAKKVSKDTRLESRIIKAAADVKTTVAASKAADAGTPAGKLAKWHKVLGIFFLLQGLVVIVLGRSVTAPITVQYPAVDTLASEAAGHQVVGIASRHIMDLPMEWVLAVMLLVFAVVHLAMTTAYRPYVARSMERGVNTFRWLSLAIGGGLLTVVTALVSGISSLTTLLVLFGSIAGSALLALGAEVTVAHNNGIKNRLARFFCGLAALGVLMPWITFGLGALGVALWGGKLPGYLYSLYVCAVLLVVAFMLATRFRLRRQGKWADGFYAERGYLLLTLVTVTLLTWQIVAGAFK